MDWLVIVVVVIVAGVLYMRSSYKEADLRGPAPTPQSRPRLEPPSTRTSLSVEQARILREIEVEAARMMPEIEAEAARSQTEIRAGEATAQAAVMRNALGPYEEGVEAATVPSRLVRRENYVAKEDEGRYLARRGDGLPDLYLVDAGDRLTIWSPVDVGGLINPKGPGLRRLGLYGSYARGGVYYGNAYRSADLSKGRWIDLVREPDNPHDKNAVAMCVPGSRIAFAYVQRGRAPAIARRMDAGEDLAAVSMWGPGSGRDDDSTFVLIGSRADLTAMLRS